MNGMRYKIDGMNCASCATVISFAFEDAHIEGIVVDALTKELVVPIKLVSQIKQIKQIVDESGHYKLIV